MSDKLESIAQKRIWTYWGLFAFLVVLYLLLRPSGWQGSTELHTLLDAVATVLAVTVGIIALVHFFAKKSNIFLFVGTGFLGTGVLDGYHAVVTSSWFGQAFPSPPPSLIPWSWNASRLFLAVLMLLSWWAWRRELLRGEHGAVNERIVFLSVGALTLVTFLLFAFVPLPRAYYPELFLDRPEELIAAGFFLAALGGFYRKGDWKTEAWDHWLLLSLIVGFVTQALYMASSVTLFDAMFDMAHVLKIVSYICVLIGLLFSMRALFGQATEAAKQTTQALRERENTYRTLVENIPARILFKDRDSRYVSINALYAGDLGIESDEIKGKDDFAFYPTELAEKYRADDRRIMSSHSTETLEEMYIKDGREVWVRTLKSAVEDDSGEVIGILGLFEDITEQKLTEDAFRQLSRLHEMILKSAGEGIIGLDSAGRVTFANNASAEMMGWSAPAVLGQRLHDLVHPQQHSSAVEDCSVCASLTEGRVRRDHDALFFRKDGTSFPVSVVCTPILEGDEVAGGVVVFTDITERKRTEQELASHRAHLEELVGERTAELAAANKELEAFAYSVSHDLRGPLRAVDGFSRILLEEHGSQLDTEGTRLLRVVRENVGLMADLINDILELSRVGRQDMHIVSINMSEMVTEVLHELRQQQPECECKVTVLELPPVVGDPRLLRQVWVNLLSNAMKFSANGDAATVTVRGAIEGEEVVYHVSDTGVGFDMRHSDKLFGLFERLHRQDEFEGTGVGLSIVKLIVERHGGRVSAEGKVNHGAAFHFALRAAGSEQQ